MPKEVLADLDATEYATADEADAAAERRVGGARWLALEDDSKTAGLATATERIDAIGDRFDGQRADDDQILEWPRTGTDYSSNSWPASIVKATIELAFSYTPALETVEADDTEAVDVVNADPRDANIKVDQVGPIRTEYFAPQPLASSDDPLADLPAIVQQLLRPLIRPAVVATYGSGRSVRVS